MKRIVIFFFIFISVIAHVFVAKADFQDTPVKYSSLQIEDGLSQISVLDILQDSKGYMWFATRNGLNRYDGRSFRVFRNTGSAGRVLSDNHIAALAEDRDGFLWVGAQHGLSKIDLSKEVFTVFADSLIYNMFDRGVRNLSVDTKGNVLIATPDGLFAYIPSTDKFESVLPEVRGMVVEGLDVTKDGKILVGTSTSGLFVMDKDFTLLKHFSAADGSLCTDDVKKIFVDSRGSIWLANSTDGVILMDINTGRHRVINMSNSGMSSNNVRCLADDGKDLFIGTSEGVCYMPLDSNDNDVRFESNNLSNFSVYSILIDRGGTRWVGTYSGGVNLFNPLTSRFDFHRPVDNTYNYMSVFSSMVYNPDNDRLYIATEGHGLIEYDIARDASKFYAIDASKQSGNILKSLSYYNGEIWCGTANGEVLVFNPSSGKFRTYYSTSRCTIYDIYHDREGCPWIATTSEYSGVLRLKDGKLLESRFTDSKVSFPGARIIREMAPDELLIGTRRHGLIKYDRNKDEIEQLGYNHATQSAYVTAVVKDRDSEIFWIGTFDHGLYQYDPKTGAFDHVEISGVSDPMEICQVVQSGNGDLWICSSDGITRYTPGSKESTHFTRSSDIRIQEFTPHCGVALDNGVVAFSGSNGFITFSPSEIHKNTFIPPVVFTGLSVNNEPVNPHDHHGILDRNIDDIDHITLNYDQNNVAISFAALSYANPELNQYAIRLDGIDEDWVYLGNRNEAYYANLAPGNYTFYVKGANNDGVWSRQARAIEVEVVPPLWKTWYAYTFYVLLFLAIASLIVYYILKKQKLEQSLAYEQLRQQQAEEFHQSKLRMFTNFSHELRTPLTLIVSPLQQLLKRTDFNSAVRNKISLVYNNSQRLQLLVNQLLDLHKSQSGKMQVKIAKDDIVPFMREVHMAFSQIAEDNGFKFSFICPQESIIAWYDKSLFEKVAFNLLSNAFKYTKPGGCIEMTVEPMAGGHALIPGDDHMLPGVQPDVRLVHIAVTDTGRGIPEDELEKIFSPFYQVNDIKSKNIVGTGIGLSLTQSIVQLHHGVIWAENNDERGATFHVIFPIDISVYSDDEIDKEAENRVVMDVMPPSAPASEFAAEGKRYTVLLVEDNLDVRAYVKECLEPYYNVIEAGDGQAAFDLATAQFPDVVVSDIMMPVKDGLELCNMLKNDMRTGHIPVILMTARSMVMHMKEGFACGADDYIVKPFNMDVLLYRIKNILASREKLRNLYGKQFSPEAMGIETVSYSDKFTQKFFDIIEKNISNCDLNIDYICKEIGLSRANLYRKLKSVTELSPMELIKNKRLEVASKLLLESESSVSEISTYVGFNSHAYFTNCFKNFYGVSPSEYVASKKGKAQSKSETVAESPAAVSSK